MLHSVVTITKFTTKHAATCLHRTANMFLQSLDTPVKHRRPGSVPAIINPESVPTQPFRTCNFIASIVQNEKIIWYLRYGDCDYTYICTYRLYL